MYVDIYLERVVKVERLGLVFFYIAKFKRAFVISGADHL